MKTKHIIIGSLLAIAPITLFAQSSKKKNQSTTKDQYMLESGKHFDKMDSDHNGFIKSTFGPIDKKEFLHRSEYAFTHIDSNNDGILSPDEKKKARKEANEDFDKSIKNWTNDMLK